MLTEFGKIFVFFLTAIIFVVIALFVAKLIRPSRPTKEKLTTYECGENPEGSPWVKFNIRFYVVALIFLIFDVEVVMLIPWAVVYQQLGFVGYLLGAIFLILLGVGMAYEWRKGDLEWARPKIEEPIFTKSIPPPEIQKKLTLTE
ncbi:MAG: NADH-quinone oxidoreductase subunit A [Ignavibacteriaceae bacterium]|nr:NADH-quinone oxidoreductase subunit A [Ignavibacteria bacterium]MBT8393179.1 NADH-quinone oxidoreductase subunit A [Ignavibacteria bacterium]NNJ53788.1 NADH-quinone oxidoreductase subunit A [Ignavibacteriaceae bacterium]NNL21265.1 NADH-quinone oxidoreductase subunit A [Ignavibacteriaceae bacterium]